MGTINRASVVSEIVKLFNNLCVGENWRTFVRPNFMGANGMVQIEHSAENESRIVMLLSDGNYFGTEIDIHHTRSRDLLSIRNALMRDLGKREIRK